MQLVLHMMGSLLTPEFLLQLVLPEKKMRLLVEMVSY